MRGIQYLHPRMMGLANKLVLECDKKGLKIKITDTWRTKSEQDKIPSVNTQVKYPHSYHCWGIAFDICRNDGRGIYDDSDGFFAKVGKIANSIGLDWGGNLWTDFVDKPHFQISTFGTPKQLIQRYGTPENFKKTWKKEGYKVEKTKLELNGAVKEVQIINHEGHSYVKLRDLESKDVRISFDYVKKMPIVTTK